MNIANNKVLFGVCCVVFATLSYAAEKPVLPGELPPAVQKTLDEQSKDATIKRFAKDNEDGQLEYEAEMVVNGHSKDVSIAPDGRLLEVEEQVESDKLPPAVQESLKSKAGKGTITKVESITKKGRMVGYEAQVRIDGRHSEIQIGPDGKPLSHEE
jgi:hypothetical protein